MSGQGVTPGEYLSPRDVAVLLGISLRTVRRRIADGTLKATKVGGLLRIPRRDVEALFRSEVPAAPTSPAPLPGRARHPTRGK